MIAWPPFRMRIFMCSKGVTSATNSTPTSSNAGRPAGKSSSTTHWMKSSQNTGQASSMPNSSRLIARSRSPVAGAMRSTMPFGKATVVAHPGGEPGSCASARPATASRQTHAVVRDVVAGQHGERRGARRPGGRAAPARIRPKTVFGSSGFAASATIAGFSGSNAPVAGLMK